MFPTTPVEYLMVIASWMLVVAFYGLIVVAAIKYLRFRRHRDRSVDPTDATRPG